MLKAFSSFENKLGKAALRAERPFGSLSWKTWIQIKTNCEVALRLDEVIRKFEVESGESSLLRDFSRFISQEDLQDVIDLIQRVVECGDAATDRA